MPQLSRLNWVQRVTVILFVTVVANWLTERATGYSLIGGDLFTVLFIGFFVLAALSLLPPLIRKFVVRS